MSHVTKATYNGDGSNKIFPIPFPYRQQGDVVVLVGGDPATISSFPSPTTVQLASPPIAGVGNVAVIRSTLIDALPATIQTGNIRPKDINDNDTVLLYRAQESDNRLTVLEDEVLGIEGELSDAVAAAAAVNASVSQYQSLITSYGVPFATGRNIFELFTASEIATIKSGDNGLNLAPKVQTAMTNYPGETWYWPKGWYFLDGVGDVITFPSGVDAPKWWGAGPGKTNIKIGGGGNTNWGIVQTNPNGTTTVRGFSADNITFLFSWNGIRLNSTTAGIDDTSGTMYYIAGAVFDRCEFLFNGSPNTCTMLSFNKVFNGGVTRSKFNAGHKQVSFRGSDINFCTHNRMDNASDCAVQDLAEGTFGSTNLVAHNDINNPKNTFFRCSSRDGKFVDNHCELDFNPGSTGTGGNQEAAIDIIAGVGNTFKTLIKDNRMEVDVYADRWLRYRSNNPYSLILEGNGSTGPGTAALDLGSSQPYFTNSGTRVVFRNNGNIGLNNGSFPMNTKEHADITSEGIILGASYPGINNAVGSGGIRSGAGQIRVANGDIIIPADANSAHYIEWSDWTGFPANVLRGSFRVTAALTTDTNGQTLSYAILNGGAAVDSGTISLGTAYNTAYLDFNGSVKVFGSGLKIQLWNVDTAHGGNFYLRSLWVKFT